MSDPEPRPQPPRHSAAGTVALIVIGLLILVPSGLCTGILALGPLLEMFFNPQAGSSAYEIDPFAMTIGLPFVLLGGGMLWRGIVRWRATRDEHR